MCRSVVVATAVVCDQMLFWDAKTGALKKRSSLESVALRAVGRFGRITWVIYAVDRMAEPTNKAVRNTLTSDNVQQQ